MYKTYAIKRYSLSILNLGRQLKGWKMLNWEQDKRNHKAIEPNYDYLPATGSFADQRRWAIEKNLPYPYKKKAKSANYVFTSELSGYCQQLALYVKCIESSYFWKKTPKDQIEIIEIIKKLISRIRPLITSVDTQSQSLLRKAEIAIVQLSN